MHDHAYPAPRASRPREAGRAGTSELEVSVQLRTVNSLNGVMPYCLLMIAVDDTTIDRHTESREGPVRRVTRDGEVILIGRLIPKSLCSLPCDGDNYSHSDRCDGDAQAWRIKHLFPGLRDMRIHYATVCLRGRRKERVRTSQLLSRLQ